MTAMLIINVPLILWNLFVNIPLCKRNKSRLGMAMTFLAIGLSIAAIALSIPGVAA